MRENNSLSRASPGQEQIGKQVIGLTMYPVISRRRLYERKALPFRYVKKVFSFPRTGFARDQQRIQPRWLAMLWDRGASPLS